MPTADEVKGAALGRAGAGYTFANSNPLNFVDPRGSGQSLPVNRVQPDQDSRDPGRRSTADGNRGPKPTETALKIEVTRDTETCNSTTGTLKASVDGAAVGSVDGFTLEPPSAEKATTEVDKRHPRIRAGTYTARIYVSIKKGKKVHGYRVFLLDVPGRSEIEIHVGNYPKDTIGCILPGGTRGTDVVWSSTEKMGELLKLYDDAKKASSGKAPTIQVKITENVPQQKSKDVR